MKATPKIVVGHVEDVWIVGKKRKIKAKALFDTGASGNSLDYKLAARAGVGPVISSVKITSAFSEKTRRPVTELIVKIHGKKYETTATLEDRRGRSHKMLIGRSMMYKNFVVDPKIKSKKRKEIIGLVEKVKVIGPEKSDVVLAKFDTGANYTSIDKRLAEKLGMKINHLQTVVSSSGREVRPAGKIKLKIGDSVYKVTANVSDRSHLNFPVLIGRTLVRGKFIIDISRSHRSWDETKIREM
jgi:hypothetical protein